MSEQLEVQTRTVDTNIHHFYCDNCAVYLGYTNELEDGYHEEIGELGLAWYIPVRGWRQLKKHLCPDCREQILSELDDALHRLGFKADGEE